MDICCNEGATCIPSLCTNLVGDLLVVGTNVFKCHVWEPSRWSN